MLRDKPGMSARRPIKAPELLVFGRVLLTAFLGTEIFRLCFELSRNFGESALSSGVWIAPTLILGLLFLVFRYVSERGGLSNAAKLWRSRRVDLFAFAVIGVWANLLSSPWTKHIHESVGDLDGMWAPVMIGLITLVLASPLLRAMRIDRSSPAQFQFFDDLEIFSQEEDALSVATQAASFADAVLASGSRHGLTFGIDGPWGVGKTSFVNLVQRRWEALNRDEVIILRFEPLRYASEPDLAQRLLRELTVEIQRAVFAPEFAPAATRYTRMVKGKTDISFLGFKLSVEPSQETLDELLDDIDEVLRRIKRKVIIVIDDLDRLDARAINNVLFAVRRTFKLSQATYVLCYDTEMLVGDSEDASRARQFLEKFIAVKLSLFVDSQTIGDFLRQDWSKRSPITNAAPDSLFKLGSILGELAEAVEGDFAANYMPIVGDMRKVKRFINAVLLLQIEKTDLSKTDFNSRDLVNLLLLHLNYPGVFRRVYVEETDGRSGIFGVLRGKDGKLANSEQFETYVNGCGSSEQFLLRALFDVNVLKFREGPGEAVMATRACFNLEGARTLEAYLRLIVRFIVPDPRETFTLYWGATEAVVAGRPVNEVLSDPLFELKGGEDSHDQFWRLLANRSHELGEKIADDVINVLVDMLPRYGALGERGLRHRSMYTLAMILDRVKWGAAGRRRYVNQEVGKVAIGKRIFGDEDSVVGLIDRLVAPGRGPLGWKDALIFRLTCSADRLGQLFNLEGALLYRVNPSTSSNGRLVSDLAVLEMREISQALFAKFKEAYIDAGVNFLSQVDDEDPSRFLGSSRAHLTQSQFANELAEARLSVKTFVIYQLHNRASPDGAGVGIGFYDEQGTHDVAGISKLMAKYLLDVCFAPTERRNVLHFVDYVLLSLARPLQSSNEGEFAVTRSSVVGMFTEQEMCDYWRKNRELILSYRLPETDGRVISSGYVVSYQEYLPRVYNVLDGIALVA